MGLSERFSLQGKVGIQKCSKINWTNQVLFEKSHSEAVQQFARLTKRRLNAVCLKVVPEKNWLKILHVHQSSKINSIWLKKNNVYTCFLTFYCSSIFEGIPIKRFLCGHIGQMTKIWNWNLIYKVWLTSFISY